MRKTVISILLVSFMISTAACGSTGATPDLSDESVLNEEETLAKSGVSEAEEPVENKNSAMSEQQELGDIILADGSSIKAADMTAIDNSNVPIAVIAGFKEDGTAFGVGVHRSDTPLQWAPDDSAGYITNFTDTACTQKSESEFSGDTDGADNWEAICGQDSEDTMDAANNYPAFHFVNTYAEKYNLSGDMASGWYMPSIAELCVIYKNREAIDVSMQKIYGLDEKAAMNGLETNWYWSSSQAGSSEDYAWFVHFFNGYAGECPKNFTNVHALTIREF